MTLVLRRTILVLGALTLLSTACTSSQDDAAPTDDSADAAGATQTTPEAPPANPFLADSVVPMAHFDTAQSDSQAVAGPTGPSATLTDEQLLYQHLGPAHFGIAISPPYPDDRRVIWSNGGDRISKIDYDTFEVLAELPLPGKEPITAETAEGYIATLDELEGEALATEGIGLAGRFLTGLAGFYHLLDVDNTLFVGGSDSIIAYRDVDPGSAASEIEQRDEWAKPPEFGGDFVGANISFDGRIVMVTNEGWVVSVARDFSDHEAARLPGAEGAVAHNEAALAAGNRPGTADWVRNSLAVDDEGGIYVVSADQVHKMVWDGATLSNDPEDGAWSADYANGTGLGSGATPSLMGFGDEDRFVVITDGDQVMNVVLLWRDEIPEGWVPPEGAPSDRIAGQLPADMGDDSLTAIQTEQSVVVGGHGAMVVNNDPASVPEGFPAAGNRVLVGYAGADPAFTPHGIQKFDRDPDDRRFTESWVNTDVSSANSVPVVSTGSGLVYTVGARDGDWTLEALHWDSGDSAFRWVTGSNRYNSLFSGINLDGEGRIIHTTEFGIVRYQPDPDQED